MSRVKIHCLILGFVLSLLSLTTQVGASDTEPRRPTEELALNQSELADRYARLEKLILRMAEFDASDNPRRAELLKKAFGISKERHVQLQLEKLVELLHQEQLARAITNQRHVKSDLQSILDLLLTENRADRLKDEQTRIKNYIREIERIQRMQRSVQGRTEGGVNPQRLSEEQARVAKRTGELHQEITETETPASPEPDDTEPHDQDDATDPPANNDPDSKPNESDPHDGEPTSDGENLDTPAEDGETRDGDPSDGKPSDGKPSDSKPSDSKPSDGKPSDGKPSDGKPSDGKPSDGKPSDGKPSDSQSPDGNADDTPSNPENPSEQFPGQDRIKQAEEKMKRAEQKLAEANRSAAVKNQEEAARKLAEAKAELEEILRQRREEEIERLLAMLESRFRKMLEMELQVYENTMRLYKIPAARRDRFVDIESGKLSFQQRRIVVEAEKCLALLRDEGSSVAFPESVEQMRNDMKQVEERLGKAKIGRITQGIEESIIEALDEMVEALQQAQLDQDQRRQQQQPPGQPQQPGDQPLVDQIAELRMLKAMQLRINKSTNRYSRLLDDDQDAAGQATDEELIEALRELSTKESRLKEITHDIVVGKNE